MRLLIVSDIHANLQALDAVLEDAARGGWGRALVLGDLVGYGADPAAVIDRVRALEDAVVIRGNHDRAAVDPATAGDFNPTARESARWTSSQLDEAHTAYLAALPAGPVDVSGAGVTAAICHGAPFDEDYYVFDEQDAALAFRAANAALVLLGHTHLQGAWRLMRQDERAAITAIGDAEIVVAAGLQTLVNPGSVGQPRDGDPRAAYALLDTDTRVLEQRRVEYDIEEAQRRIRLAGLPAVLADRLSVGR